MANVASNLFSAPAKTFSASSIFGSPAQNALTKLKTGGATMPAIAPQSKAPAPVGTAGMNTPSGVKYVPSATPAPIVQTPKPVAPVAAPVMSPVAPMPQVALAPSIPPAIQQQPLAAAQPSFSGLVSGIGNTAQGLANQSGLVNTTAGLLGSQGQMTPEESAARQRLAQQTKVRSDVMTNIETHPSDLPFQMGREAVAGRNIEAQNQSLADQISAYAAQRQANTSAYQGEANAQQGAGNLLATSGSLQSSAAGLFPDALRFQGMGNDSLAPASRASALAEQVRNGTLSPQAAEAQMSSLYGGAGATFLNQALQGYNYNTGGGQAAAQQSNAQLGGTAVQGANAAVYQQALPAYYQMQSQLQNVEGLGGLLLKTANGGQINPFDAQFANLTVGQLRNQLSNEDQVRFNSTLASFQGAASQLLANSSGQIPTDVSHNISLLASGNLQLGALKAMVDQAQKEGSVKLTNQGAIVNNALQTLQQGTGGGGSTNDPLGIL